MSRGWGFWGDNGTFGQFRVKIFLSKRPRFRAISREFEMVITDNTKHRDVYKLLPFTVIIRVWFFDVILTEPGTTFCQKTLPHQKWALYENKHGHKGVWIASCKTENWNSTCWCRRGGEKGGGPRRGGVVKQLCFILSLFKWRLKVHTLWFRRGSDYFTFYEPIKSAWKLESGKVMGLCV